MASPNPPFFSRIWLSFVAFFRTLGSGDFAKIVRDGAPRLPAPASAPEPDLPAEPEPEPASPAPVLTRASEDAALQLLALLQREGRFVDFLQEDVAAFSDEEIGVAARVVHEGCNKALSEHLTLAPVHAKEEESEVEVPAGFDPSEIRLSGNVVGEAPFRGVLTHRGWRVDAIELPQLSEEHDVRVLAPAEVEL